jgi:myo-inositol-1(or 4)-monophosphatase
LPEADADLALLEAAAQEAGRIALRHFAGSRDARDKPDGQGPVTEADLEVDAALREILIAARPDYGWLSEESPDGPARLAAERAFIVDPIDGTRAFVAGRHAWGHSLAIAEHGRVIAGVVHMPKLERTYAAASGQGATCNGARIEASRRSDPDGAEVLANRTQMEPAFWPGGVPDLRRHFRPSIAYRMCLAAAGRFDAMLTFRDAWEWDIAAGALIAREAGAVVTDRLGRPPVFNNPVPQLAGIIVAGPELHAGLMARLPAA